MRGVGGSSSAGCSSSTRRSGAIENVVDVAPKVSCRPALSAASGSLEPVLTTCSVTASTRSIGVTCDESVICILPAVPATPSVNAAAEDTLAENTVAENNDAENNDAGSTADSDAVTPAGSDQTTVSEIAVDTKPATAIPAERTEAMPLPADQTASKNAAPNNDAPAANTADTIDEAFDIAAGSLTPPPAPPEAAPEISEPEPAPPPAEFEPASIVGLSADQLEARFGTADLLRREGTAEVWQYRLSACVVDYFVYPDAAGIRKIVAWDWRAPVLSADIDALKCRQDLAIRDQTTGQG